MVVVGHVLWIICNPSSFWFWSGSWDLLAKCAATEGDSRPDAVFSGTPGPRRLRTARTARPSRRNCNSWGGSGSARRRLSVLRSGDSCTETVKKKKKSGRWLRCGRSADLVRGGGTYSRHENAVVDFDQSAPAHLKGEFWVPAGVARLERRGAGLLIEGQHSAQPGLPHGHLHGEVI